MQFYSSCLPRGECVYPKMLTKLNPWKWVIIRNSRHKMLGYFKIFIHNYHLIFHFCPGWGDWQQNNVQQLWCSSVNFPRSNTNTAGHFTISSGYKWPWPVSWNILCSSNSKVELLLLSIIQRNFTTSDSFFSGLITFYLHYFALLSAGGLLGLRNLAKLENVERFWMAQRKKFIQLVRNHYPVVPQKKISRHYTACSTDTFF